MNVSEQVIVGSVLAGLLALSSYRLSLVTQGGAVAMFCLGIVIFGFGGWRWAVPILVFFGFSNVLSKWRKAEKASLSLDFEKGNCRDFAQVFANGGVAGICAILFAVGSGPHFYLYYCVSLAAASADTWATEVGTISSAEPRLITSFRAVPAGTSGGVSFVGTMSALAGAWVIGIAGWAVSSGIAMSPETFIGGVTLCGLFGSLVDSLLGATVQGQYRCSRCSKVTERRQHCESSTTERVSGISLVNNDVVNFISTLAAFALSCFIF